MPKIKRIARVDSVSRYLDNTECWVELRDSSFKVLMELNPTEPCPEQGKDVIVWVEW